METQTYTGLLLPPEALLADENIRFNLKPSRIESLSQDILARGGVMQNLEVEPLAEPVNGCEYRVTDGHYRHQAVIKLNKEQNAGLLLPCVVVPSADKVDRLKRQLSANLERENQSPMDVAVAIEKLVDAGVPKMEIRQIFSRPGGKKGLKVQPASNSFINMMLSFLDFPRPIQRDIHDGIIGVAGAYTLTKKPRDKWEEIVAGFKEDMAKAAEAEEKEEARYLAEEAKAAEAKAKEADAAKALEAAKADFTAKSTLADELIHAEVEAHQKAKAKGISVEERKRLDAEFKAAEERTRAAIKLAEAAKTVADKLEGKVQTASEHAEERRKKLEAARKLEAKKAPKTAGPKDVEKAAAKAGVAGSTVPPLNATDMRKAVDEWALPGSFPKVQAIALIIKECFAGGPTTQQAYNKMAKVTGEKAEKVTAAKK